MRKILIALFLFLAVSALVCTVFFIAFLVEWNRCAETKSVPEITEKVFPDTGIKIAQRIPFKIKVKTSWSLMPVSAEITPPPGAQEGNPPEIVPGTWNWGTRMWEITLWIQPYRDGSIAATPVKLLFEGGPDGKYVLKTEIPSFQATAAEIQPGQSLSVAGQVPLPEKGIRSIVWFLLAGLLIITLILWFVFRKKKTPAAEERPVWQQALDRLALLKEKLQNRTVTAEQAVSSLTDIVRFFLERQFSLRAEHQTTHEFLESLRKDSSVLDLEQKRFLQEFLSAADMIKFARLPAEKSLFEQAASRAETLIRNTTRIPDEKES